jgi:class 3 adenylate cyclase
MIFGPGFFGLEEDNLTQKRKLQLREGELREVTVLFADIKGFTNLSSRLDPEVIHARMDELLKVFSRCGTFYGGFVDKYIGDAIMALFGAKKASEQDTERAIRAGLKMVEQLQLYNHNLRQMHGYEDVELSVRIGINTGLVSVGRVGESREGDFTVYGPEVNLASRMESNAPVGRIMVPDTTKKLVEQIFEFEPLGLKQVKGIDKAVDCWSPLGLKTLEASLAERYGSSFIGRDTELRL